MDADLILGTDVVRVVGANLMVDATDLVVLGPTQEVRVAAATVNVEAGDRVVLGPANAVTVIATSVKMGVSDCMLDAAGRRGPQNRNQPRRALVHDFTDGLSLNFNHDYPGGVTVYGPMKVLEKGVTTDVGEALKKTGELVTLLPAMQEEMRKQVEAISTLQGALDELKARVDHIANG